MIDAKQAFQDKVFSEQPLIVPCGESIIWQSAYSDQALSKTLRYPAEDSDYEKLLLENMILEYRKTKR